MPVLTETAGNDAKKCLSIPQLVTIVSRQKTHDIMHIETLTELLTPESTGSFTEAGCCVDKPWVMGIARRLEAKE